MFGRRQPGRSENHRHVPERRLGSLVEAGREFNLFGGLRRIFRAAVESEDELGAGDSPGRWLRAGIAASSCPSCKVWTSRPPAVANLC